MAETRMRKQIAVPELDIDAGRAISANGRLERRIVAALLAHLDAQGFQLMSVWDGEEETFTHTAKDAMELIFNLDEASVRFHKKGNLDRWHGVLLILGNGEDIISDWNYTQGDPDGFNAEMDAFVLEEAF